MWMMFLLAGWWWRLTLEGQVYCLECRAIADGEPLCEDELVAHHDGQEDVMCVVCGCLLSLAAVVHRYTFLIITVALPFKYG